MSTAGRTCACGCGELLPPGASLQMLYRPGHRQRAYQRKRDARVREALAAVDGGTAVNVTATHSGSGRKREPRRPSRDGYGSRTYMTPTEARSWEAGVLADSLREKLDRAAGRASRRLG